MAEIDSDEFDFEWNIWDFFELQFFHEESKPFSANGAYWKAELSRSDTIGRFWFEYDRNTEDVRYAAASPELRIINESFPDKTVIIKFDPYLFSKNCFRSPKRIIDLTGILKESNGFLDGRRTKLTITCQMNVQMVDGRQVNSNFLFNQKRLFDLGEFADCVLVCGDGEVKAMKFLLASQSDVFRAMFQSDTKEARTGRVEIEDVRIDVMTELFNFTSCGKVGSFTALVEELFVAADKYNIIDLKFLCIAKMCKKFTNENLCKRLVLAWRYKLSYVEEAASDFLSWQNCERCVSNETYEELILTANNFGKESLASQCVRSMQYSWTKQNVCGRLAFADRFNLGTSFKKSAADFIVELRLDIEALPDYDKFLSTNHSEHSEVFVEIKKGFGEAMWKRTYEEDRIKVVLLFQKYSTFSCH